MFAVLLRFWKQLPVSFQDRIYRSLKWTGVPYFVSYMTKYKSAHHLSHFAGNLLSLKEECLKSGGKEKQILLDRFDAIIDNLVMKNGVKKTTYSMRLNGSLSRVFCENRFGIEKDKLKVLDVPSSVGTASLDLYEMLKGYYTISSYVLGDLYFNILYDKERECIYDAEGNLLQVKLKTQFFSIYRPYTCGDVHNIVTYCLFLPLGLFSWYLKRKYKYRADDHYYSIALIHPNVESQLMVGPFSIREMDVFKSIEEKFDVIISCNLLQRNYFPEDKIEVGIENLRNALNEDGLLILGNTESVAVSKKSKGDLILIKKEGEF